MNGKSGVYAIINLKTDKLYIGSSKNISKRFQDHMSYLKANRHNSKELQKDYNTLGKIYFKVIILEECEKDLLIRERFHIENNVNLYNQCIPNDKGSYLVMPQDIKDKISETALRNRELYPERYKQAKPKEIKLNQRKIKIKCITPEKEELLYDSIIDCSIELKIKVIRIQEVLRGKSNKGNGKISNCTHHKGYKFEYL